MLPDKSGDSEKRRPDALTPELIKLRIIAGELARDDATQYSGHLVFGEGNPHARLAVIGEAPGETEEREGRPFVGRAGQLLNRLLAEAGIERDKIWITNVVKIRPTVLRGQHRQNRTPSTSERNVWLPLLKEELKIIAPELLLGLGATAGRALIGRTFQLTRDRGNWFETAYGRYLVTFHPSYLLKRRDDKNIEKQFIADLATVQKRLAEGG